MVVAFGLECLLKDEIAIGMENNHDVLVSQVCPEWEAASVIHVQPAEGYTMMKTWLDGPSLGLGAVVGSAGGAKGVGSLGLVDLTF
jgi:hypothetical protein